MRPDRQESEDSSQDSFLDVVANVVGVLVILVMLIGAQASQRVLSSHSGKKQNATPTSLINPGPQAASEELEALQKRLAEETRAALSSQGTVVELASKVASLGIEAAAEDRHRIELAMHRQIIEEDIEKRRNQLDTERQRQFDVQRQLLESQIKLEQLTQEHISLASSVSEVETIECVPTPLAKEVDTPSLHLRLRKGLVSIVPVEKLNEEIRAHQVSIVRRLQSSNEVTETFGPIDGYRARLKLVKRSVVVSGLAGQRQENILDQFTDYLPMSDDIGQNVEQALLPGAMLCEYLDLHRRESPPVDVWLYTDSFKEFQTLKRALRDRGYSIAIRPLPPGAKIGSSPYGTKSATQ